MDCIWGLTEVTPGAIAAFTIYVSSSLHCVGLADSVVDLNRHVSRSQTTRHFSDREPPARLITKPTSTSTYATYFAASPRTSNLSSAYFASGPKIISLQ
jgi:hypothetical protein